MKIRKLSLLLAIGGILLASCKKDKEDPTIIVNEPANHSQHTWGEMFHASATFEDDRELSSYHIHIADETGAHTADWDYESSGDVSGKTYEWSDNLTVPDSVPDMLWLNFEVTDAEGKMTESSIMLHFSQ